MTSRLKKQSEAPGCSAGVEIKTGIVVQRLQEQTKPGIRRPSHNLIPAHVLRPGHAPVLMTAGLRAGPGWSRPFRSCLESEASRPTSDGTSGGRSAAERRVHAPVDALEMSAGGDNLHLSEQSAAEKMKCLEVLGLTPRSPLTSDPGWL